MQRGVAAAVREVAVQELHVGVAVDDAGGRGGQHAHFGLHVGFLFCGAVERDEFGGHALDGAGEGVYFAQLFPLLVRLGDDPFPHVVVWDGVFFAEVI